MAKAKWLQTRVTTVSLIMAASIVIVILVAWLLDGRNTSPDETTGAGAELNHRYHPED